MGVEVGLCASCKHSRKVPAPRAVYWMCELSRTDPSFPRYPRLPVLRCSGYEQDTPREGGGDVR